MSNSSGVAHQQNKDRTGARAVTTRASNAVPEAITILISKSIWLFHWEGDGRRFTVCAWGGPYGGRRGEQQRHPLLGYGVNGAVVFADGSDAGELIDQEPNDCLWLDEVDGRSIFEQNDLCSSGSFEVQWVAPPAGSGPVSIYVAAIAANGNSTSSGDVFVGGQFDFDEGVVTVEEVDSGPYAFISAGEGRLDVVSERAAQCAVFSLDGRVLFEGHLETGRSTLGLTTPVLSLCDDAA